jgi:putative signal transducing protein
MSTTPQEMPDNRDLVQVFDTQEESEAMVIRGLLDSAGIDALITGLDSPQDVLPGVGGVVVRVAAENADAARRIIEEYAANPPAEDQDPPAE